MIGIDMKLETLVNNGPAVIFLCRAETGWPVETVTANIVRFGYSPEDFISGGLGYADIIYPADLEIAVSKFSAYVEKDYRGKDPDCKVEYGEYKGEAGGHKRNAKGNLGKGRGGYDSFTQQYRFLNKSGNVLWVEAEIKVLEEEEGKACLFQVTVFDISRWKHTEKTMPSALDTENELKRIINSGHVIVFLWRAEPGWPVDFVSENISELGYTPEDFTSGSIFYTDIIHPDDLDNVRAEVSKNTEGGRDYFSKEYRILAKSGEVRYVDERTLIRRNEKGEITCYQGILLDITQRKKAEVAQRLNASRLEALVKLDQMAGASLKEITDFAREEAVRLTGSKLGYLAFMDAYESTLVMHSWSDSAMEECSIEDKQFIYPVKSMGLWGEAVRQRKPIITNDYPAPNLLKKGYPKNHVHLIRHLNIPVFDGKRIVAVAGVGNKEENYDESDVRQLTLLMQGMWQLIQRKQLEEALRTYSGELSRANEELRSVNMMKTEFVEEMRFPERAEYGEIMDYETLYAIDSQQQKAVNTFIHYSEKLRRLVDSLLYQSLEKAGKIDYSFEGMQLKDVLSDAFLNNVFLIGEKALEVEKEVPASLPEIRGDREKLTALFTALVDHAIKFTPQGGKLALEVKEGADNVHIVIADSGKGISKELIPYLFDRLYQVNDSGTRRYQGLESGLYICKNIVDAHKGEIWFESEEGLGNLMHVKLPK
ncbi:sensory transduction histidine kinase [Methanosarcina siciliae HI350]|uniref:histidine kinase n=1 Tax=Methanosarcina siciliae HI350 TaxID=1434119 RepID=A0A0E3PHZ0_9EURY|nr:PAS domain-containing protein [Methanosarcina siciliae]AKB34433.1 sensory transduction histidine kinase [Methanosarcina siciliae HI350]